VIEWLTATSCCFDEHAQIVFMFSLSDVLIEFGGAAQAVEAGVVVANDWCDEAVWGWRVHL